MTIEFNPSAPLTVGIELEVQLVDKKTFDLKSVSQQVIERIGPQPWLQPELLQGMLEVTSSPSRSVNEASRDIREALKRVNEEANALDASVACAGTHPTAKHWERKLFPIPRYKTLIDRNQFIARRLMIFGMHVHVGTESGDLCIALLNELLYDLPVFLAMSASSPFWESIDTGLASSRSTIFEAIPTGGHPCQIADWADFSSLSQKLVKSKAIRNVKDIWWDVRPSPAYGTLEIRVCDGMPTVEENMAVAALIHSTARLRYEAIKQGRTRPRVPDWIVRENKWRAARYGLEAELVISEEGDTRPLRQVAFALLDSLNPVFNAFDYWDYDKVLRQALLGRTSYSLQREIFHNTGDLRDVTKFLIEEMDASLAGLRPYKMFTPVDSSSRAH